MQTPPEPQQPSVEPLRPPHPVEDADVMAADADRGRAAVGALDTAAGVYEQSLRAMLDAAITAVRWDGLDALVGLSLVEHLVVECGLPRPLAVRVETVALRLSAIPAMAAAYDHGLVGFDHLAQFVGQTRRHAGPGLARLDDEAASLAAALAEAGRLWEFDDRLSVLIDLRAPGWANRQERRADRSMSVTVVQDRRRTRRLASLVGFDSVESSSVVRRLRIVARHRSAPGGAVHRGRWDRQHGRHDRRHPHVCRRRGCCDRHRRCDHRD